MRLCAQAAFLRQECYAVGRLRSGVSARQAYPSDSNGRGSSPYERSASGTEGEWPPQSAMIGTCVWTGRALQAGSGDRVRLVLLFCIRPLVERALLLAIMDIRAHPFSISARPLEGPKCHQITNATARPFFHILKIQLADLSAVPVVLPNRSS